MVLIVSVLEFTDLLSISEKTSFACLKFLCLFHCLCVGGFICGAYITITKTRLCKYIEDLTSKN